jgi:hypothetical protein
MTQTLLISVLKPLSSKFFVRIFAFVVVVHVADITIFEKNSPCSPHGSTEQFSILSEEYKSILALLLKSLNDLNTPTKITGESTPTNIQYM